MPSRIVLVTPAERHDLAAFRQAGFTGYLATVSYTHLTLPTILRV